PPGSRRTSLLSVSGRDDVGLDRVLGGVARVARDDATLVERADAQVGAAARFAAVSAASEDDRALLLHGAVAAPRQGTLEIRAEGPHGGIATPERPLGRAVVLQDRGDVRARLGRVVWILVTVAHVVRKDPVF